MADDPAPERLEISSAFPDAGRSVVELTRTTHEPCSSGRESAHFSLEKFEPTHVGCYEPVQVHGPNASGKKRKEALPEPCLHPRLATFAFRVANRPRTRVGFVVAHAFL